MNNPKAAILDVPEYSAESVTENVAFKRLRFRSTHRGCKEMDLVLGTFADEHLEDLSPTLLSIYGRLLDESDADIWDWLMGTREIPNPDYAPLLALMIAYRPNA